MAAFSEDGYGQWCQEILTRGEGIDLTHSRSFAGWHTPVTVSMAYAGDRAMVTHGHDSPVPISQMIEELPSTRAVIAELDDEPWWLGALADGAIVFADVGWDPSETWDRGILKHLAGCHAFTPNEIEALNYTRTETAAAALSALSELVPLAVVTRGAAGVIAIDQTTGEAAEVAALEVPLVDPTGAGDVFGAALVAGTLEGWPLQERLRFATLASSLAVQQFGGGLAAPGWGDIADWWRRKTQCAASGDSRCADAIRDYGFLTELLERHEGRTVRRAEATIARWADI